MTAWETRPTAGHSVHGQSAVYDENGKDVAIVYDGVAHANLIAAAPELLAEGRVAEATLTLILRTTPLSKEIQTQVSDDLVTLRTAIAKAEQG